MGRAKLKFAVLAIGGNSLIRDKDHKSIEDQFIMTQETCRYIRKIVEQGWNLVITHGNGPQVGFMLRRSEISQDEVDPEPLDCIGADTQGSIGYMIQQTLCNEFQQAGLTNQVASVITQVRVEAEDPAFSHPTKPIGSFMDKSTAKQHEKQDNWDVSEDAGRGWRRVVASPMPKEIVERDLIQTLVDAGFIVIATGGGGIPVVRMSSGKLQGVPAVIDKDFASALLASRLSADRFIVSTAVDKVYLNYGKENQKGLDVITISQAREYLEAGEFPDGSMGPKIHAAINFIVGGGEEAIITSPELLAEAIQGKAGTHIIRG
jgi:carbamate kinase